MADSELAIVVAGRRGDWPGGPCTLTPRAPTREPNDTLWFGAELDDGGQVWFRIGEEAIDRMPAEMPAGRGRRLVDAPHRLDHAGPSARARHQPLRRSWCRRPARRGSNACGGEDGIRPPRPVPPRPRPRTRRRLPAGSPLPPSARTPGGRTRGPCAASTPGSPAGVLEDATLAGYLAELHEQGRAPSSASTAVTAARFRTRLARVLAGYRRTAAGRGRGPGAAPSWRLTWPRSSRPAGGRGAAAAGVESDEVALKRGQLDAVITGLIFMAGMRRSEVSALRWAHVVPAAAGDGMLVTVRLGKTNPEDEARDVRFVKADVAGDVRTLSRRGGSRRRRGRRASRRRPPTRAGWGWRRS